MTALWMHLIFMLIVILIASQFFTNALEHFGHKIGVSAGVTGSIFAAVATALPETTVPIIAIVAGTADKVANQEISVGAILGAPLMLSTLSTVLMALFAIKKRGLGGRINPENVGFKRDMHFFLIAFFFAAIAMYVPLEPKYFRAVISVILVCLYITYLFLTCRASGQLVEEGHGVVPDEPIYLTRIGLKDTMGSIMLQLLLALVLLLYGAKGFITNVETLSHQLHISALLLSLLIIPIATELPEKINSITWIQKNKDTLGFGNITGAMVFQGTLLPAIGIMLTPWAPSKEVVTGIIVTFLAALWLRVNASKNGLTIKALLVNGGLYLLYLCLTLL
ncbi:MAG: sodium:calcium antiporter [Gammaproteobacteria bacterium]|nr:sodium:calcium antiporter [Gammaproteobacteria bacterium]